MKPRRWYSSPELNPNPAIPARLFPAPIYWAYTARTCSRQGAIIKCDQPPALQTGSRREPGVRLERPRERLIDAA